MAIKKVDYKNLNPKQLATIYFNIIAGVGVSLAVVGVIVPMEISANSWVDFFVGVLFLVALPPFYHWLYKFTKEKLERLQK